MILEKLELSNFRVFQGHHEIDLLPRGDRQNKRPVVLFGGLNGAGKTSILSAVRLILFGKQALGHNVTQKTYDVFLATSVHRCEDILLQTFNTSVSLSFSYATQGEMKQYKVTRAWMVKQNASVVEDLTIEVDGKPLNELSKDQCQGFLNELIPIGVADLFFFDGEKIAELAEDTQGVILGDAIKKLLGLDLLGTLSGDLGVILRSKTKESLSADEQGQVSTLEKKLDELEATYKTALDEYGQMQPVIQESQFKINQLNAELLSKGGAWAETREQEIRNQADLSAEISATENTLRELLASNYPISIAADYAKSVLSQLKSEQKHKQLKGTSELIDQHLKNLKLTLNQVLDADALGRVEKALDEEFSATSSQAVNSTELVHDISDTALASIESSIENAISAQTKKVSQLKLHLKELRDANDQATSNIARAPVEAVIEPIMEQIKEYEKGKEANLKKQAQFLEQHKAALRESMSVTRQLDKLTEASNVKGDEGRTIEYAKKTRGLLAEFSMEVARQKVRQLEDAFAESFSRLARKGDMALRAKINHVDFSVRLVSSSEREINKNELSAGEKQIYAISILEALAKTSGRHLPIIIDTPLGRLDSVHRTHLVNQYFPNASHQVIILSTDTEVDEHFYQDLLPHISHAYRLEYSPELNSTVPTEGYFWDKSKQSEVSSHVA